VRGAAPGRIPPQRGPIQDLARNGNPNLVPTNGVNRWQARHGPGFSPSVAWIWMWLQPFTVQSLNCQTTWDHAMTLTRSVFAPRMINRYPAPNPAFIEYHHPTTIAPRSTKSERIEAAIAAI